MSFFYLFWSVAKKTTPKAKCRRGRRISSGVVLCFYIINAWLVVGKSRENRWLLLIGKPLVKIFLDKCVVVEVGVRFVDSVNFFQLALRHFFIGV